MKEICDMTYGELEDFVESSSGIKMPPDGASAEKLSEWFVATVRMICTSCIRSRSEAIQYAGRVLSEMSDANRYLKVFQATVGGDDALCADQPKL